MPPKLQMTFCVLFSGTYLRFTSTIKINQPRLSGSNEMDNLHILAKLCISWKVRVCSTGDHVVCEGQMLCDVLGWPITEITIQQTLVSSIKGTSFAGKLDNVCIGLPAWFETGSISVHFVNMVTHLQ